VSSKSFTPMLWDCERQGCFNKKKRLKFEVFADCLPGKISFSDIDAIVEINGNLLIMEWKGHSNVPVGQKIMFKQITRFCPALILVVEGNAEDMSVSRIQTVWHGEFLPAIEAGIEQLVTKINKWANWAKINPVTPQKYVT